MSVISIHLLASSRANICLLGCFVVILFLYVIFHFMIQCCSYITSLLSCLCKIDGCTCMQKLIQWFQYVLHVNFVIWCANKKISQISTLHYLWWDFTYDIIIIFHILTFLSGYSKHLCFWFPVVRIWTYCKMYMIDWSLLLLSQVMSSVKMYFCECSKCRGSGNFRNGLPQTYSTFRKHQRAQNKQNESQLQEIWNRQRNNQSQINANVQLASTPVSST